MKTNKIIKNTSWLVGCRIAQAVLTFVVSTLTARYLGPSNYGIINYVASLVAFAAPFMSLGLSSVLVYEIVSKPEKEGETLGTSLVLTFLSSILCMIGVISFVALTSPSETETIIVSVLYSIILIAQAFEMIQYWFQAKLLSKYTAVVSLVAYAIISAYKIFLLVTQKNIYWFAVSNSIDHGIIAICLFVIYIKRGQKLSFSKKRAKQLLSVSKYYIITNVMITIFAQIDRIMLKHLIDETATAFYSAAITCAGLTSFVFTAVIDSARPVILENKDKDNAKYEKSLKQLYAVVIYSALLQSIFISLLSGFIINFLYGEAYAPASQVLCILVWYTAFSYYGGAQNIWVLAEKKQKYLLPLNGAGAAANIVLNFLLIPRFGAVGAALASLVTQFFTNIIMVLLIKPLRRNFYILVSALNPVNLFHLFANKNLEE